MSLNRRRFIASAGSVLWLPLLESLVPSLALAQAAAGRKKFIGVFSPNGAMMPNTENGDWTFARALKPIADAGHQPNTLILRGVQGGNDTDPHWLNCAGFLSCKPLTLAPGRPAICGKSFDQFLVDKYRDQTALGSVHVGFKPMDRDFSADHSEYSDVYLDTVAWRADNRPMAHSYSARSLFDKMFTSSPQGARYLQSLHKRRKSVLDVMLSDLSKVKRNLTATDRGQLEAYTEGVREVEKSVIAAQTPKTCATQLGVPASELGYIEHFTLIQKMIAQAFECNLITSATIMYDDGVGFSKLQHMDLPSDHHGYAHHANNPENQVNCERINSLHAGLYAQLLTELKTRNQLQDTMVLWGSNMSDGNTHQVDNLPLVLSGGGVDLKFGQEVGTRERKIKKADLFVEMAGLYDLGLTAFGAGPWASNGTQLGLKK